MARDPAMREKVALNETDSGLWGLVARGRFRKRGDGAAAEGQGPARWRRWDAAACVEERDRTAG